MKIKRKKKPNILYAGLQLKLRDAVLIKCQTNSAIL